MGINATYIQGYASSVVGVINGILIPALISVAFLVFVWGIYKYFIHDSDKAEKEGKTFAIYGIVGFVLLFSVWGIVQIFMGTLGLTSTNVPAFPTINTGATNSNTQTPAAGSPASSASGNLQNGVKCNYNDILCSSGYCDPSTDTCAEPPVTETPRGIILNNDCYCPNGRTCPDGVSTDSCTN